MTALGWGHSHGNSSKAAEGRALCPPAMLPLSGCSLNSNLDIAGLEGGGMCWGPGLPSFSSLGPFGFPVLTRLFDSHPLGTCLEGGTLAPPGMTID